MFLRLVNRNFLQISNVKFARGTSLLASCARSLVGCSAALQAASDGNQSRKREEGGTRQDTCSECLCLDSYHPVLLPDPQNPVLIVTPPNHNAVLGKPPAVLSLPPVWGEEDVWGDPDSQLLIADGVVLTSLDIIAVQ
ncbi:hypothetical protein H920_01082 [Fukomys damarensis]|uniref:Uncharacterized protein n=1 Tax=Fukomys damarensis TaxID=885580 RepID=A0A091E471_FUKDA|nr:hypothetical protein H920_01082 [Fukomys damarensis]